MSELLSGGRYKLLRQLGEGGMGVVHLAHDSRLDSPVVIKFPHRNMLHEPGFVERFQREIRSLVKLNHPHIVSIIDLGEHESLPYCVMGYLGGGSLADRKSTFVETLSKQQLGGVWDWLPSIAKALDFIHSKGYIHRDVKPANILFDEFGNAYLSDFGIAKVIEHSDEQRRQNSLTAHGIAMGTPEFMAPELCEGTSITGKVDQYALAVTLYEMIAGRCPLVGPTPLATVIMHKTHSVMPLHEKVVGFPIAASNVVSRGLSKDPAQRFANCMSLCEAFLKSFNQRHDQIDAIDPVDSGPTEVEAIGRKESLAKRLRDSRRNNKPASQVEPRDSQEVPAERQSGAKTSNDVSSLTKVDKQPTPTGQSQENPRPTPPPTALRQTKCLKCSTVITIPNHWSDRALKILCPACRNVVEVQPAQSSTKETKVVGPSTTSGPHVRKRYLQVYLLAALSFTKMFLAGLLAIPVLRGHDDPILPCLAISFAAVVIERRVVYKWTRTSWKALAFSGETSYPKTCIPLLIPVDSSVWQFRWILGVSRRIDRLQLQPFFANHSLATCAASCLVVSSFCFWVFCSLIFASGGRIDNQYAFLWVMALFCMMFDGLSLVIWALRTRRSLLLFEPKQDEAQLPMADAKQDALP